MPLAAGTRFGPYEIVAPLGAGGMGEVYRARDTRLDRTVAVKILPSHLSASPEAKQRFEREAKAISSLSHPNICHLYDVGTQDDVDYLVMEYLEGETLADRLKKGALPLDQLLRCGQEIAAGLDKAHRSGVVHRDLKPGNIMLTKTGAKLMDFGLAKSTPAMSSGLNAPTASIQSPAGGHPLTAEGTVVGTFQYMSPEQIEGKDADARSDIFALGAVLHEMATGKRAFEGKSAASAMAAVLERDPAPISSLQPASPPALERIIKKCLAKDPDLRWQSAADLASELAWIAESGPQVTVVEAARTESAAGPKRRIGIVGAMVVGAAVVASIATWLLKPAALPAPQPVTRTSISLPPGQRLAGLDRPVLALSPDGTLLAYVATEDGKQQLYLRAMDSLEAKPIPDTEGAVNPFFSPDGQWLGFFAGQKLKKVSVSGGAVLTLADAIVPEGASWSSQGIIAFAPSTISPLQQVPEGGGTPQPLTRLGKGEATHRWPQFLPGGKAVLFAAGVATGNWDNAQVAVEALGTGERRTLISSGMSPAFVRSGQLVYAQAGNLMAVPFDSQRLDVRGTPMPVVEGILQAATGAAQYSISASGSLAYVSGGMQAAQLNLVWVTRNGVEQPVNAPPRDYAYPRISPDGLRLAVNISGAETQVWLYDLTRDTLTRLTFEGNLNSLPVWTPDGKRIAVTSDREGPQNIFWQRADGSGGLERLTSGEHPHVPMSWSPDGQLMAFGEINPTTGFDIWVLRMSDHKAEPFLRTPFNESTPRFSPDGKWIAYVSDESGRPEIYVQAYPGPGGKWQISVDGGREPAWNRNGRELFYRNGDKMMAVDIATQTGFAAGKPRMLFAGTYEPTVYTLANYDVAPDGQRFLMLKRGDKEAAAPTQINVVLNWTEELKRRVTVK